MLLKGAVLSGFVPGLNALRPMADIDLLVEFTGRATFDQYTNLLFFLEDTFGCKIDLTTRNAVRPQLWSYIEPELIYVT